MQYDKENRLVVHMWSSHVSTYTYSGDGRKRTETINGTLSTLIWDGDDYYGAIV